MEKQTKQFNVDYNLDWEYGIKISKLREDLDEIEKLGATHIEIEAGVFYDCAALTIEAKCERLETDEEFEKRTNAIKQREALAKQRELNELNRLKKKYGM